MQNPAIHSIPLASYRRPRLGLLMAALLMMVTAVAMVSMAQTIAPFAVLSTNTPDTETAVRGVYAGANEVLTTGSSTELAKYIDDDSRLYTGDSGGSLNLTSFVSRLIDISQGNPDFRLSLTGLTTNGSEAVANVSFSGGGNQLIAGISDGTGEWIDQIAVRQGVISSLEEGTSALLSSTVLMDSPVDYAYSGGHLGLATLFIERGDTVPVVTPGPLVVVVQHGRLNVSFDGGFVPRWNDELDAPPGDPLPGQPVAFRARDQFSVRAGSSFRMSSEVDSPVILRVIALVRTTELESQPVPNQDGACFPDILVDGEVGETWEGAPGTIATLELRRNVEIEPGATRLRVEQIGLMPGSSLVPGLTATLNRQFVVWTMDGAVVVAPVAGKPALGVQPVLLDRQQGMSVDNASVHVSQIGGPPATLIIVSLEQLGST